MKKLFICFLLISGCVTKPLTVHRMSGISPGMALGDVMATLDDYDVRIPRKDGGFILIYEGRRVSSRSNQVKDFSITFNKYDLVESLGSSESSEASNSGANFAAGVGSAISNSVPKTTNCVSQKDAWGNVTTNCSGY